MTAEFQSVGQSSREPPSVCLRLEVLETLSDGTAEPGTGQRGDAQVGLAVEGEHPGNHFSMIMIIGAKVQVADAAVFTLVDKVTQQDVQVPRAGQTMASTSARVLSLSRPFCVEGESRRS